MAISVLFSPPGALIPRPVEALTTVQALRPPATQARTPPQLSEVPSPIPNRNRDLAQGLGPIQQRRMRVSEVAQRNRERVEAEAIRREASYAADRLERVQEQIGRVRQLAEQAQETQRPSEERAELERQAREMAQAVDGQFSMEELLERPDVASLAAIAIRPEGLGISELARIAREEREDVARLRAQAVDVVERIRRTREELFPPTLERAEQTRTFADQQEELSIEERERLESPADAAQVAREVRVQAEVNAGDLFLSLSNILPQNVIALLV